MIFNQTAIYSFLYVVIFFNPNKRGDDAEKIIFNPNKRGDDAEKIIFNFNSIFSVFHK